MGDIGDVWNAVKDTATLFASGQRHDMGTRAFGCPSGVQPNQLDWANSKQHTLQLSREWTNRAKEWFGASTGTKIRVGVTWTFGGTSSDHPGLYLYDAYMWAIMDYSAAGTNYTITGTFGDAVPFGNSAQLPGTIEWSYTQFGFHMEGGRYDFQLRGNGYGNMNAV